MIAYKAFNDDLTCLGYQFRIDKLNVTTSSNCKKNGFHCAENPLDCLSYYRNWNKAQYWIVEALGDIDEDDIDSKISCTQLRLIKRMNVKEFVAEALKYIYAYPNRKNSACVFNNEAEATELFAISRGLNPIACGKLGTVLGFAQENSEGIVEKIAMLEVDGRQFLPDIFYNIQGTKVF